MTIFEKVEAALKTVLVVAFVAAMSSPLIVGLMAINKLHAAGF